MEKHLKIAITTAFPSEAKLREGMMQRINEIDGVLIELGVLHYISVAIRSNFRKQTQYIRGNTKETQLNVFLHQIEIFRLIRSADLVYVHAITTYILFFIPLFFLNKKVILDLHGVVPEETELSGQFLLSRLYSFIEKIAVKKSNLIVVVTRSMSSYLKQKYNLMASKIIFYPITDGYFETKLSFNSKPRIIYAGGRQKWQNFDKIVLLVEMFHREYTFEIYVNMRDLEEVQKMLSGYDVVIDSVNKVQLYDRYRVSDIGILLRDDIIVNNVANPTKLNEYLSFGIVPLMLSTAVGDFQQMNYEYFEYDNFISGLDPEKIREYSTINSDIYRKFLDDFPNHRHTLMRKILLLEAATRG